MSTSRRLTSASVALLIGVALAGSTSALSLSDLQTDFKLVKNMPMLPLGLHRRLRHQRSVNADAWTTGTSAGPQIVLGNAQQSTPDYEAHYFDQRVSHDPKVPSSPVGATFKQRFWFDAQYYKPGGPVILLDGGETDASERIPFLRQGILQILANATGGLGVIFEHRYYGRSMPVRDLSTDSLRFLTTMQSLQDSDYFANHVQFPGLEQYNLTAKDTPWLYYGGSYAGAKAAFARSLFPNTWWGAIASSAVTTAIEDYWEYYTPIIKYGPRDCVRLLESHSDVIDKLLSFNNSFITSTLKSLFGLENVTANADFVNALTIPLSTWQARNWDDNVGSRIFEEFCDSIERDAAQLGPAFEPLGTFASGLWPGDPRQALAKFASYAAYVKANVSSLCPEDMTQDECFGSDVYDGTSLEDASWRSWSYQVCTEWGYFIGAPPTADEPSIVSRLLTTEYTSKLCRLAFAPGKLNSVPSRPNIDAINQWGSFDLECDRLAFVDGSEDPWLYATPHSPHARKRRDTLKKPFKIIKGGVHHWDENGLLDSTHEPKRIKQIHEEEVDFVQEWMQEWKDRGKWRTGPWK
ncbi:hypothetical protein OIV83_003108 [Microbotryomycetes sp. JL201]|nr:hypothetical protein OIV83_003108 [Microbotryomycetes sp. JL201]